MAATLGWVSHHSGSTRSGPSAHAIWWTAPPDVVATSYSPAPLSFKPVLSTNTRARPPSVVAGIPTASLPNDRGSCDRRWRARGQPGG
jgi:hypothetical protein